MEIKYHIDDVVYVVKKVDIFDDDGEETGVKYQAIEKPAIVAFINHRLSKNWKNKIIENIEYSFDLVLGGQGKFYYGRAYQEYCFDTYDEACLTAEKLNKKNNY